MDPLLKNFTIEEFRESLQNYTQAIKKAKSQNSLKNYHSRFVEFQKNKFNQRQEVFLRKILNPSSSSPIPVNNYELFLLLYSSRELGNTVKIPMTLCITENQAFLVKYSKQLKIVTGDEIIEKFYMSLKGIEGFPVCIFKSLDGKLRFFNSVNCVKNELLGSKEKGYYQEFIIPFGNKASVLIAVAKKNKYNKYFLVHNSGQAAKQDDDNTDYLLGERKKTNQKFSVPGYLKEELEKAKRVLKKKKSLLERQGTINNEKLEMLQSINSIKKAHKQYQIKVTDESNAQAFENIYVVRSENAKCLMPYSIKFPIAEIETMNRSLFTLLYHEYTKKHHKTINELHIVYIKDQYRGWLFLKVKAVKFVEITKLEPLPEKNLTLSLSPKHIRSNPNIKLSDSYNQPLEDTLSPIASSKSPIKIRQFSNIKARNAFQQAQTENDVVRQSTFKLLIDQAALKYDIFTKGTKLCPYDISQFQEKYGCTEIWASTASKIHKNIIKSNLRPFFQNFTSAKLKGYQESIQKLLSCHVDNKFKEELRNAHRGFSISSQDYEDYRGIFLGTLKKITKDEDFIRFIMLNFDCLREYIVEVE